MTDRVSVGDEVWVKVINVTKEEPIKVGLSLKMVDQDTAEDLVGVYPPRACVVGSFFFGFFLF